MAAGEGENLLLANEVDNDDLENDDLENEDMDFDDGLDDEEE